MFDARLLQVVGPTGALSLEQLVLEYASLKRIFSQMLLFRGFSFGNSGAKEPPDGVYERRFEMNLDVIHRCFRAFCHACNGYGYDCFDDRQCETCWGAGEFEICTNRALSP